MKERILIVDDEATVRKLIRTILDKEGFECQMASGVEEARSLLTSGPFDLMLCDIMMPGESGITLIQEVSKAFPDTAIVMVTAVDDPETAEQALGLGVYGYVVKPFEPSQILISTVNALKRRDLEIQARSHLEQLEETVAERTEALQKTVEQLSQAHRENTQLLSAISSLLVGIDPADRVIRWNARAEDILGVSAEDILQRPLFESKASWDWDLLREGISRSRSYQEPVALENVSFKRQDGTHGFLDITLSPVLFEDNQEPGLLVLGKDVTEQRQLEVQLSQAQRLEAIGQLAAGIAHEINTPIQYVGDNTRFLGEAFEEMGRVLAAYNELLEAVRAGMDSGDALRAVEAALKEADLGDLSEEVPAAVAQTLEGVERVTRIVRSMKAFSHPGTEEMTEVDLNKALENTITVARNEWKYVAEMKTDLDPSLPPVYCLPGELNQVFLNLIINAAHAVGEVVGCPSGEKGTILVSTGQAGGVVEVRISDTGPGIPEGIRDRIFDPFFTTKEVGRGTGQGLAISRSVVVDKHGGSISVETEPARGTTFTVRLPPGNPPRGDAP